MQIKASVTIPRFNPLEQLEKDLLKAKLTHNTAISKLVEANFKELLYNSAQRYGTYVASWRVSVGRRGSSSDYEDVWRPSIDTDPSSWYAKGSGPAISVATQNNAGVWDEIINYALTSRAIYPSVVVYNNSPHADQAESGPLRPENSGAVGAFDRFESNLRTAFNQPFKI